MLKYRHTTVDDLPKIEEWIAADPAHAGVMKGSDFVLIPDEKGDMPKGRQCIEVQDDNGVVFYVHLKQALILEVQFPPNPSTDVRRHQIRSLRALEETVKYFKCAGAKLGHYVMFYQSISEGLVSFGEKYLGFRKASDFHKADLL
jgi:hypothetical protein